MSRITQLALLKGLVSDLELRTRTGWVGGRLRLDWDTIERHIAEDKIQDDIAGYYIEALRGGKRIWRPAKRGVAYRYMGDGWEVYLVKAGRKRGQNKATQAPRAFGSRHDANCADGYYTALKGGDVEALFERCMDRGGYEAEEVARCLNDGAGAAAARRSLGHQLAAKVGLSDELTNWLAVIMTYGESGYWYGTQETLAVAQGDGRSQSTVSRRMAALEAAGAIERIGYRIVGRCIKVWRNGMRWKMKFELRVPVYRIVHAPAGMVNTNAVLMANAGSRTLLIEHPRWSTELHIHDAPIFSGDGEARTGPTPSD